MLLLFLFSMVLLGSATGSDDTTSAIARGIAEACLEGAEVTLTTELQRVEQHLQQQMTTAQQEIQRHLLSVQIEVQQKIAALQKEGQQQMTAVQQQLTAVLKQLGAVQTTFEGCPTNWVKLDNNCYLLSTQKANGREADAACTALDHRARLASVHPANKDHVTRLVTDSGASTWIGLYRLSGDSWIWRDGTPLDVTNWLQGQPDNAGGDQDCVAVWESDGSWLDYGCTAPLPYICQITL